MKKKVVTALVPVTAAVSSVPVFAQSTGTANADVVSAFTTAGQDMVATGTALIPVALTVVTLTLVVTFGYKLFKRLTGR